MKTSEKAERLQVGRWYATTKGPGRFVGFDGYGFVLCQLHGQSEKTPMLVADVLKPAPAPAPAPVPVPNEQNENSPCPRS